MRFTSPRAGRPRASRPAQRAGAGNVCPGADADLRRAEPDPAAIRRCGLLPHPPDAAHRLFHALGAASGMAHYRGAGGGGPGRLAPARARVLVRLRIGDSGDSTTPRSQVRPWGELPAGVAAGWSRDGIRRLDDRPAAHRPRLAVGRAAIHSGGIVSPARAHAPHARGSPRPPRRRDHRRRRRPLDPDYGIPATQADGRLNSTRRWAHCTILAVLSVCPQSIRADVTPFWYPFHSAIRAAGGWWGGPPGPRGTPCTIEVDSIAQPRAPATPSAFPAPDEESRLGWASVRLRPVGSLRRQPSASIGIDEASRQVGQKEEIRQPKHSGITRGSIGLRIIMTSVWSMITAQCSVKNRSSTAAMASGSVSTGCCNWLVEMPVR